mgnify:CR=1 FL=1
MFKNREFCEYCNKIQPINIVKSIEKKEYTIGLVEYEKYIGECSCCNKRVYSYELNKKTDENRNKELKILQSSIKIEKILTEMQNKNDLQVLLEYEKKIDSYIIKKAEIA